MKMLSVLAAAVLILGSAASPAYSDITSVSGHLQTVFADPSDVVVVLDTAGSCGGVFFIIPRSNLNFKELTAVVLTAFATGNRVQLFVSDCAGDRNVVDHGSVRFD